MSIRTRSSVRRDSVASSLGEEGSEDMPRSRRGGGPPPPPPPLPRIVEAPRPTMEAAATQTYQSEKSSVNIQTEPPKPWTLKVRTEPTKSDPRRSVVGIMITSAMEPKTLSLCIQQTCGIDPEYQSCAIAGLFRESDSLFLSFHDILDGRDDKSVFSLSIPQFEVEERDPWWQSGWAKVIYSLCVLTGIWFHGLTAVDLAYEWSGILFRVFVNIPLQEMYRYGPSFVGWEGASLPHICARITYHGDEEFWKRNMEECERIYLSKEEAMLRMFRPFLYLFTLVVGFYAARALVREHAISSRPINKGPDRDMVETYNAFNVIFRQMNRAMNHDRHR